MRIKQSDSSFSPTSSLFHSSCAMKAPTNQSHESTMSCVLEDRGCPCPPLLLCHPDSLCSFGGIPALLSALPSINTFFLPCVTQAGQGRYRSGRRCWCLPKLPKLLGFYLSGIHPAGPGGFGAQFKELREIHLKNFSKFSSALVHLQWQHLSCGAALPWAPPCFHFHTLCFFFIFFFLWLITLHDCFGVVFF